MLLSLPLITLSHFALEPDLLVGVVSTEINDSHPDEDICGACISAYMYVRVPVLGFVNMVTLVCTC